MRAAPGHRRRLADRLTLVDGGGRGSPRPGRRGRRRPCSPRRRRARCWRCRAWSRPAGWTRPAQPRPGPRSGRAVRLLAQAALLAADDPAAAVPLFIEAAEAGRAQPRRRWCCRTPRTRSARWSRSVAGDVGAAEYLLGRALAAGAGGPVGAATAPAAAGLGPAAGRALRHGGRRAGPAGRSPACSAGNGCCRRALQAGWPGAAVTWPGCGRPGPTWSRCWPAARSTCPTAEAVEELAVAAARLRRRARIEPVLDRARRDRGPARQPAAGR